MVTTSPPRFCMPWKSEFNVGLENAKKIEDCLMVNDRLVGFDKVFEMVMNDSLNVTLPPNFIKSPPKNPMTTTTVRPPPVPITEFLMKEDEIWKRDFSGKCSRYRPKWNDSGAFMCARWWMRGKCFCNCNNKARHVGASTIPQVKHDKFSTYIAKVCRENSPPLTSA